MSRAKVVRKSMSAILILLIVSMLIAFSFVLPQLSVHQTTPEFTSEPQSSKLVVLCLNTSYEGGGGTHPPLADVKVRVESEVDESVVYGTTNVNGETVFYLERGSYVVKAKKENYEVVDPENKERYVSISIGEVHTTFILEKLEQEEEEEW